MSTHVAVYRMYRQYIWLVLSLGVKELWVIITHVGRASFAARSSRRTGASPGHDPTYKHGSTSLKDFGI